VKFQFFVFIFCFVLVSNLFSQKVDYEDLIGIWDYIDSTVTYSCNFKDSTHLVWTLYGVDLWTYTLDTSSATTRLYTQLENSTRLSYFLIKIVDNEILKIQGYGDANSMPEKWDDDEKFPNTEIFIKSKSNKYFSGYSQKTQNFIDSFYTAANTAKFYTIDINHDKIIVMHNYKSIHIKSIHELDHYIKKNLEEIKRTRLMIDDHDLEDWHPGFLGDIYDIIRKYSIKNCTIWQNTF
jgi:hypothetical protein